MHLPGNNGREIDVMHRDALFVVTELCSSVLVYCLGAGCDKCTKQGHHHQNNLNCDFMGLCVAGVALWTEIRNHCDYHCYHHPSLVYHNFQQNFIVVASNLLTIVNSVCNIVTVKRLHQTYQVNIQLLVLSY